MVMAKVVMVVMVVEMGFSLIWGEVVVALQVVVGRRVGIEVEEVN